MTLEKRFKKILSSNKIIKLDRKGMQDTCADYTGAHMHDIPIIQIDGKLRGIVRCMFEFFNNRAILPGRRLSNRCGSKSCLNPRHWNIPYESRPDDKYGFYLKN